jgi:L-malate glycosyltransferase
MSAAAEQSLPAIAFMWEQFSAYHIDRLEACAKAFAGRRRIIGIEVASRSRTYAWQPIEGAQGWERHTLFPGEIAEAVPWRRKLTRSLACIRKTGARDVFLCNQDQPEILSLLPLLRLTGRRVYAMLEAKFDDHPRHLAKEALKPAVLRLFNGGLLGGARHMDYYRFLGMPAGMLRTGYDTVSIDRIHAMSGEELAPAGVPHAERDFVVVARFVAKKNLSVALHAFAMFRKHYPGSSRRLILCGSGPVETELRDLADALDLHQHVVFTGFVGPEEVARTLSRGLALVLPSVEEQWGLVVNEAVALGIPVLCSDNVGARDSLVRTGVNGFVFEPGNAGGLGTLMGLLSDDVSRWADMALACRAFAPLADVRHFATGVAGLIGVMADSLAVSQTAAPVLVQA